MTTVGGRPRLAAATVAAGVGLARLIQLRADRLTVVALGRRKREGSFRLEGAFRVGRLIPSGPATGRTPLMGVGPAGRSAPQQDKAPAVKRHHASRACLELSVSAAALHACVQHDPNTNTRRFIVALIW